MNIEILEGEIFRNIPNSIYHVSTHGRIYVEPQKRWCVPNNSFSNIKEHIKKLSNNNSKKYWRVLILYKNGTRKNESVHRLVAQAFVTKIDGKEYVNHIDGDKDNNHFSNLEWVTNQENIDHRYKILKSFNDLHGSKGCNSKLTEKQAMEIAVRIKKGESYSSIIKDYPFISTSTLYEMKAGRSWRHLGIFKPSKRKKEKYFDLRYSPNLNESLNIAENTKNKPFKPK